MFLVRNADEEVEVFLIASRALYADHGPEIEDIGALAIFAIVSSEVGIQKR